MIPLSSTSHVYTALGALEARAFVEQIPGARTGRQPKPRYRATASGIQSYGEWLVGYVREDRRRQAMFVLGLSALAGNPDWVAEILDRYEQAWLEHDGSSDLVALGGLPGGAGSELIARILPRGAELTAAAKGAWVQQVRAALKDAAAETSND